MKSIWKGRLGFGLVGMEVKLYKAVDQAETEFHLMHQDCGGGRIKYLYQCQKCQAQIAERGQLKKGYEYSKDQYIILEQGDLERLPLKTLHQIEVIGFVEGPVDPRALETAYYLAPDKGNEKPFGLLYQAMQRLNVKAIGKLAYREREHLCLVQPFDGVLLVQTLCYADEIRPYDEIKPNTATLSEKEIGLGEALVKEMVMVFDHATFKDEYREALEKLIEAKVEGKELAPVAVSEATSGGDLVSQLLASLKNGVGG